MLLADEWTLDLIHPKGIRGAICLLTLTFINLVGFAAGLNGLEKALSLHSISAGCFIILFCYFFTNTQIYMHMNPSTHYNEI